MKYIDKVVNDTEYKHPKLIPVVMPRHTGKTRLYYKLRNKYGQVQYNGRVRIYDNFERVSFESFLDIIDDFRSKDKIVILIYTLGDDEDFRSKLASRHPSIVAKIDGPNIVTKYPDGSTTNVLIENANPNLSAKKEAEINNIFKIFKD